MHYLIWSGENFDKIVSFEQSTLNLFLSEINEKKNYIKINNQFNKNERGVTRTAQKRSGAELNRPGRKRKGANRKRRKEDNETRNAED